MSIDRLISRLMTVYGEPKTDDPTGFLMEYQKALGGYPDEILDRTGDVVIRTIGPFWPKPAESVKIAAEIANEIWRNSARAAEERKQFETVQKAPASPDARARVQQIVDNYMTNTESQEAAIPMTTDVARDAFETMQRGSQNQYMHKNPPPRRRIGVVR